MKFYGGSVAFQLEISLTEIFMGHGSSHDGQGDPGPRPRAPAPNRPVHHDLNHDS